MVVMVYMHHIFLQSFCRPRNDWTICINLEYQLRFEAWNWSN